MRRIDNQRVRRSAASIALGAVLAGFAYVPTAAAAEPFEPFLDGLRRRGMFDMALEYLDWARTSPLVSADDRQALDYQAAVTLVEGAKLNTDPQKRLEQLERAREKFTAFVSAQPNHPSAGAAGLQLGNVLSERAKAVLDKSRRPSAAADKDKLLSQARELFAEAQKVFAGAEQKFQAEFDAAKNSAGNKDDAAVEARREARLDLMQAQLYSAHALADLARTHPADSEPFKKQLAQAAEKYGQVYEKYRRLNGGLYARMWQGRCFQDLGNSKQALAYYQEILALPDDAPESRSLKAKALRLALQCWIDGDEPKLDEALRRGEEWLKQARGDEDRTPEGLAIRWLLCTTLEKRASDSATDPPQRKRIMAEALKHAQIVAKYAGDHQQAAKQLVARVRNVEADTAPATLAEARDRGKATLDEYEGLLKRIAAAPGSPDEAELPQLREQADAARQKALGEFDLALDLRDDDTPTEDLNQVRYFLCYLYFRGGWHYDAAVLGEFVAHRYPEASAARSCAALAVAAMVQAYNDSPVDQRQPETARLVALASLIAEKWPGDAEADKAWMILADMALRSGDLPAAAEHLSHVSPQSPQRVTADLKAGQALWGTYLNQLRQPTESRPSDEKMNATLQQAQELLERGIAAARNRLAPGGQIEYTLAAAELSLAQLHLAASRFEQAVEILERAENGPLALAAADHPLTKQGNLALEIYKAALQSFVATQSLDKAEQVMAALDQKAAASGEGAAALTRIYLSLGRELQQQVARLKEANQPQALDRVVKSFEVFLDKVAGRTEGNSFSSLSWVAETYFNLGSGLNSGAKPAPEAKRYLEKAAKTYERIRDTMAKDANFAPQPDAALGVTLRLARCERALGGHAEALELLVGVLKSRPAMLDAQIAAAETLQAAGAKDAANYLKAIQGDRLAKKKDGSTLNIIWGWRKLVAAVQGKAEFRDTFYDAYHHLADCLLEYALAGPPAEKTKNLQAARAVIEQLVRTDPALGRGDWATRYDALLKRIQTAQGQPATGLKSILTTSTAAATPGKN